MTNLTFEQLKKLPQYKIAHKMYYKKFPFCVRFYSRLQNYDRWDFNSDAFKADLFATAEVKRWLKRYTDFEYRTRHDCHLALYLKDIDAVSRVFNRYKDEINIIEGPVSEKHQDTMVSDLNVTVREKLFYNEYRYKVSSYLYRPSMDAWIDMLETCEASFEKDSYRLNPTLRNYIRNKQMEEEAQNKTPQSLFRMHRWIPYSGTATIYLKEYDDVCTLHMLFKNIITSTTKIILKSELE